MSDSRLNWYRRLSDSGLIFTLAAVTVSLLFISVGVPDCGYAESRINAHLQSHHVVNF